MVARSVLACTILLAAAAPRLACAQDASNSGAATPIATATPAATDLPAATAVPPAPDAPPGEPTPEPTPASIPVAVDSNPEPLAERFAQIWANGTSEEQRLAEVRKVRDEHRLRGVPGIARVLTVEGFGSLDTGNREEAAARFTAAVELDPGAADARIGLAAVEGGGTVLSTRSLSDLGRAWRTRLSSPRSLPYLGANGLVGAAGGLAVAGILAIVALLLKKQRLLRHDVAESLKRRFDTDIAQVLGWVVVLLPLLLTFDLYWSALYWAVVIWAYLDGKEQVIAGLSLVLLAALVPAAGLAARLLQNAADPYTIAASEWLDGVVDRPALAGLEAYAIAHPDMVDAQILVALIKESNGEPRQAIIDYRELAKGGGGPAVFNNLANVYYRLDEKDRAFEFWRKAIEADPGYALAHYNLSLYYFGFFEFDKKDEHFNKAKEYDAMAVDRWIAEGAGVVDAGPDRVTLRRRLWTTEREGEPKTVEQSLRAPHTIAALVALVLGFFYGRKRRSAGLANSCVKCGAAFCHDCKPGKERDDYCLQCVHLFIRKDGVSPQMRADKVKDIARNGFQTRVVSSLATLLAPGAGAVFRGHPLAGFLLLVLWCLALAAFVVAGRGIGEPGVLARVGELVPAWIALVPAGVVWLFANLSNAMGKD